MNDTANIPLPLAELLHVTLGTLADALEAEGHSWAPTAKMILDEYTKGRDTALADIYGVDALPVIDRTTSLACDQLLDLLHAFYLNATVVRLEFGGEAV